MVESFSNPSSTPILSTDIIITLTIFSNEYEFILFMATDYIKQIVKKLNYSVKKITCGEHIESSRQHYHIMFRVSTNASRRFKDLASKLHRISATEVQFPSKQIADLFRDSDLKISTMYEGEVKKHKKKIITFGEESMRYPFKEYPSFSKVNLDLQFGFTEPQLKSLWEQSHQDWKNLKKQQNEQMLQQMQEKSEYEELNNYLEKNLKTYPHHDMETLIRHTMTLIWEYKISLYKLKRCKSCRVASIKDQAISYLVFNHYITTENIVNLTY